MFWVWDIVCKDNKIHILWPYCRTKLLTSITQNSALCLISRRNVHKFGWYCSIAMVGWIKSGPVASSQHFKISAYVTEHSTHVAQFKVVLEGFWSRTNYSLNCINCTFTWIFVLFRNVDDFQFCMIRKTVHNLDSFRNKFGIFETIFCN